MKKKVEKKEEKGITLIALVVTIIVLLLLAGVSFLAFMGENSVFNMSKKSAKDTERENLKEEIQMDMMGEYDENGFDIGKFKEKIEKEYGVNPDEIVDTENGGFTFPLDGYIVKIEKDETGKPKVEVEGEGNKEELPEPPTLLGSDTKIEFDPSDWTNKGVKVTITLDEKIDKGTSTLQYSIDGGINWDTYRKPFEVVENNTVIIARLFNGVNESSGYATGTITRIDKLPPNILNVEETHTTSTVTLNVVAKDEPATATDGESEIDKYYFMIDNSGKWEESDNPQYTFEKLKQGKDYTFRVKIKDKAKNETEKEEEIKVSTRSLQDLGQATSNTVIDFSPDDWTAEGVQVTITTNAEISGETRLQYSINEGVDWTDYNDTPFMVYENETVIIARLYDGTNESGYATGTVTRIDKVAPHDTKIEVVGESKTSKIGVRVSSKDDLSGIKRYKFYYSTNGGANYIEAGIKEVVQEKESTIEYEYEKLTDGLNYTLKVEAYDYVNNKEEATVAGSTSGIPIVTSNNLKIVYTPTTWSKEVTVSIIPEGLDIGENEIQYMIETGEWTSYNNTPFTINKKNTAITARLYDGTNESAYSTATVTLIDKVDPSTLNVSRTGSGTNNITVSVTAEDGAETTESGKSGIKKLIYYYTTKGSTSYTKKEEVNLTTANTGTYTATYKYTGLTAGVEYTLKVEAYDQANNMKETTITASTNGMPTVTSSNLKIVYTPTTWSREVTVSIIPEGLDIGENEIQYMIEGGSWQPYNNTPFTINKKNTAIVARLYDGTNESAYSTATVTLIDKVDPSTLNVSRTGSGTNNITVSVTAEDGAETTESGKSGIKKLIYYYSTNGGTNYTKKEEVNLTTANTGTYTATYKYTGLTAGISYTLKVEAYDQANNMKYATTTSSTGAMPTVTNSNLKIGFTPTTWAKETTVSITPTGLDIGESEIQYMIEGGSWTPYNNTPFKVNKKNTAITARLYDGTNESAYSTATVTLIDKVAPSTVSISENTKDSSSITVNVTAADGSETTESGKSGIKKLIYYYSTNNGSSYTYKDEVTLSTSNTGTYSSTHKYTGLTAGSTYRLKVEAYDEAGNMKYAETASGGIKLGTAPTMSSLSASRDWTSSAGHSITLTVSATDNEGGTLNYNVQYGTSTSYGKTATGSATAGNSTTIKLTGLSQYTRYYYKVTATDSTGLTSTNYKDGNYRTYCIGTYCSGGYYGSRTCTVCSGLGYRTGSTANGATCSACSGSGRKTTTVTNGKTCTASGCVNGKITTTVTNGKTCSSCSGKGKVKTSVRCTAYPCSSYLGYGWCTAKCTWYYDDGIQEATNYCDYCGKTIKKGTDREYRVVENCPIHGKMTQHRGYGGAYLFCSTSHRTKYMNEYLDTPTCEAMVAGSCPTCGGDGYVDKDVNCTNCGGDGKVDSTTTSNCTTCGGDGKVTSYYTYDCSYCTNGTESYQINCTHGYWNSHYRCSTHGENAGQKHGDS